MKISFNRIVTHGLKTWERQPAVPWVLSTLWVLLISSLAFFWNLGSIGLIDETEPLFAEAARQMTVTGDWITPFFNGATRFDKPPLIYWLMVIAYKIFGVNEFAVRLPSALSGLALTSFCFYTLRYFGNPTRDWGGEKSHPHEESPISNTPSLQWHSWLVASLGAAMVALNPMTLFFGRTGYSDMLLSACMGGGLLAFFIGYAQPERRTVQTRWYLAFYVLIALAVLAKGPIGIVLPGLIIGSFLLYVGKVREVLREILLVRGALIFLAISLPWYILVTLRNGQTYIDAFFGHHNFERFTSIVNQHWAPWYYQLLVAFVGFAPWSIALPIAIAQFPVFQRRKWLKSPRKAQLGLFALFWVVVILTFFTISVTKYFSYTLPLMPGAAILVALWWSDQIVQVQVFHQTNKRLKLVSFLSIALFVLLTAASFYTPSLLGNDSSMPNLGALVNQANLSPIGTVIWGTSAIAGIVLLLRRQLHGIWFVTFLGFAAFLMFVTLPAFAIVDTERQLPLRQISQSVVQVQVPGEELVEMASGFDKSSLVFYTQRPVTYIPDVAKALPYLQEATQKSRSQSVLVVATRKSLIKAGLAPNQYQEIANFGIYQLLRVSRDKVL
jgi:4-amino-4-deoxy-L-arabinose transferase-like glycosyltransferase